MKKHRLCFALVLLSAALLARAAEPLQTLDEIAAALPRADAAGQVVSDLGKPVPGVDVFLYYQAGDSDGLRSRLAGRRITNDQGRFKFEKAVVWEPLPGRESENSAAKYVVIARRPRAGMGFKVFMKDDPAADLKITLAPMKPFIINVKDPQGKPLEGARVFIADGNWNSTDTTVKREYRSFRIHSDIGLVSGVTGHDGKVNLLTIPDSLFWAEKDGYTRNWYRQQTLFPGAQIRGRVTDADGKPVPGAAVGYSYRGKSLINTDVAVTDADGYYVLKDMAASGFRYSYQKPTEEVGAIGSATLVAKDLRPGSSLIGRQEQFTVKPGDHLVKDLKLERGVVFAGQVVDLKTGKPVSRARMMSAVNDKYDTLTTDEDGRFRIIVPPGSQVRLQWESGSRDAAYIIDREWRDAGNYQAYEGLVAKDLTGLVLKLKTLSTGPLAGRVLDPQGKPVKGAEIHVHSEAGTAQSDADGSFTLKTAFRERDFDLLALGPGKKLAGVAHLKAGATEAVIRLEPTVELKGRAVTPAGEPAGNLSFLFQPYITDGALYRLQETVKTAADGAFTAKGVCPKSKYYAFWSSDQESNRDYDFGNATLDLPALKPGEPATITARQYLNTLMGKVVDEQGKPLEGARIALKTTEMTPQDERNRQITSAKDGAFAINRLALGKVAFQVIHPKYRSRTVEAESDAIDCEVKLTPRGNGPEAYRFIVQDVAKAPLAGAEIQIMTQVFDTQAGKVTSETVTLRSDGKGHAVYPLKKETSDPKSGRRSMQCSIQCVAPGYDPAFARLTPDSDPDTTLTLRRSGGEYWSGKVVSEDGKPLAGAKVTVALMRTTRDEDSTFLMESPLTTARSDKDGRFELKGFPRTGGVSLNAMAEGFGRENIYFDAETKKSCDFTLSRAGSLLGKVVIKATGQPVASGSLYCSGSRSGESTAIKPDGTFRIDNLKAGTYRVGYNGQAKEDRKWVQGEPVNVIIEAGKTAETTVEVDEGTLVKGVLIDPKTGKAPREQMAVYIRKKSNSSEGGASMMANPDGGWEYYLPPGEYTLQCYDSSNPRMYDDADAPTIMVEKGKKLDTLKLELQPAADGAGWTVRLKK